MNPMLKKYVRNIGFAWLVCLVLFAAFWFLVLGPQRKAISKSSVELVKVKNEFAEIIKLSQRSSMEIARQEVAELRSKAGRFCVDFANSSNLTLDISRMAKEKRVNSFVINSSDVKGDSKLPGSEKISENKLEVSYAANNFHQFASFINSLERHNPIIFVDGFSITRAEQAGQGHEATMNLSYFVKKTDIK